MPWIEAGCAPKSCKLRKTFRNNAVRCTGRTSMSWAGWWVQQNRSENEVRKRVTFQIYTGALHITRYTFFIFFCMRSDNCLCPWFLLALAACTQSTLSFSLCLSLIYYVSFWIESRRVVTIVRLIFYFICLICLSSVSGPNDVQCPFPQRVREDNEEKGLFLLQLVWSFLFFFAQARLFCNSKLHSVIFYAKSKENANLMLSPFSIGKKLTLACVVVFWLLVLSRLFTVLRPFSSLANVVLFLVSRPSRNRIDGGEEKEKLID